MIERLASVIVAVAACCMFVLFGRWVVQDTRRAFCKFWPDDPYYPHKPWKFAVFRALGYFAFFVGVMNGAAVLLLGLMPSAFRDNTVVFIAVMAISIFLASLVVRRSVPRPA